MPKAGDRIELVRTDDEYTRLVPGDRGTVTGLGTEPSGHRQVHVRWDSGSTLSLLDGIDAWIVVTGEEDGPDA